MCVSIGWTKNLQGNKFCWYKGFQWKSKKQLISWLADSTWFNLIERCSKYFIRVLTPLNSTIDIPFPHLCSAERAWVLSLNRKPKIIGFFSLAATVAAIRASVFHHRGSFPVSTWGMLNRKKKRNGWCLGYLELFPIRVNTNRQFLNVSQLYKVRKNVLDLSPHPPRMPVTTRIITFFVGDPNQNLHVDVNICGYKTWQAL